MRQVALKTSTKCADQGITNHVIDAASQTMFPTIAISRTRSATTAVRLVIFTVSASKKKSGGRNVIRTKKSKQEKEKLKGKTKVFAMAQNSESESDVESESDSFLCYLFKVKSEPSSQLIHL